MSYVLFKKLLHLRSYMNVALYASMRMRLNWIYIFFVMFFSACTTWAPFEKAEKEGNGKIYRVLLIQSSDAKNVMSINQQLIERRFDEADIPVKVEYVFHFTQNVQTEEAMRILTEKLKIYDENPPDLILAVNDDSFNYLLATGLPFTYQVPIVFSNVSFPIWRLMEERRNVTGQIEKVDFRQAYELAKHLFGEIEEIQFIYGFQRTDGEFADEAVRQFKEFPELSIMRTSDFGGPEKSKSDTIRLPEKLENPLVVSLDLITLWPFEQFTKYYDREKSDFPVRRIGIKAFGEEIYSPFFSYYYLPCINVNNAYFPSTQTDMYTLPSGCLGGYMNPRENQVKVAVETSLRILKGEPVSRFPIDTAARIPVFDWNAMQHWKIQESQLPAGSRIVNKPFVVKYRNRLIAGGSLGGVLVIWLIILLAVYSRKARVAGSSAARKLKQEQKRMQLTVNSINEGILSFDSKGMITSINPAALSLLGMEEEETLIGEHIYSCLRVFSQNSSDFYWLFDMAEEARKSGLKQIFPEGTFLHLRNNKTLQIIGVVRALFLNNQHIGTLFAFRDCTDKLRQSQFLEFSMAAGDVYTWKLDEKERIIAFHESFFLKNEGQGKKKGISYDEFLAKVHPDDRAMCLNTIKEMRKNKKADKRSVQLRFLLPSGYTWFEFRISSMPATKLNRDTRFYGICLSIQLLKETESSMIQILKDAEESHRLKSEFLANMSHEIRTPLNVILGFSTIIEEVEPEERNHFLELINYNCDILLQTINDILDISRVESGYPFQYKVCDLEVLFSDIWKEQQTLFNNRDVQLFLKLPEEKILIETDPFRLKQLIVQLIENAGRFTESGSVTLGFKFNNNNHVTLFVSDTGIGIEPEDREIVFERFYKLDKFTAGGGLGLSLCKEIVTRMNGTITISDGLTGEGTCVTVVLPVHQSK